mgnify:CR=1 FL=1
MPNTGYYAYASGELIYEVVQASIRQLLNPELTASWEKGLTYVAEGSITEQSTWKSWNGLWQAEPTRPSTWPIRRDCAASLSWRPKIIKQAVQKRLPLLEKERKNNEKTGYEN